MIVNGAKVYPVESIGTKVPAGVNEEGDAYTGGVIDDLNGYKETDYNKLAESLNAKFSEYPIDITIYGVDNKELFAWVYTDNMVTFDSKKGAIIYVQPQVEIYTNPEAELQDGTWYGRDDKKTTVVEITVADKTVTNIKTITGEQEGESYEEALEKAKEKSTYGDFSTYEAADPSKFAGGSGSKEDPYKISNAEELIYLSDSINADTDWEGIWFEQTADISLRGIDWTPIGWALEAEIDGAHKTYCAYPFQGNYDGAGHIVSDLTIGSENAPSALLTLGLFGYTCGEYVTNDVPTKDTRAVRLADIHLKGVSIYGRTQNKLYAGALLGMGQEGIIIDRCDAEGVLIAETSDSHCQAGGLVGSGLRGVMTNCWTNVNLSGKTDVGRVYAGGLIAASNRVTIINAYTLGETSSASTQSNKTFVGGIDGMEGGIHINCYSMGNVSSAKFTDSIGANNGLMGGISVNKACYFNSESVLSIAGSPVAVQATGANYSNATDEAIGKTKEEITSKEFAKELNQNIATLEDTLKVVNDELDGGSHLCYYTGDGSDLEAWTVKDDKVVFGDTQKSHQIGKVSLPKQNYSFTGEAQMPEATVLDEEGNILVEGTDYKVSYSNNINAGTATVTVTGIGNYFGTAATTFTIAPLNINTIRVSPIDDQIWTGKKITPTMSTDVAADNYSVSYRNNVDPGTATITLIGKGNYTGTKMVTFRILFTDMTKNYEFDNAIFWALDSGITTGYLVNGNSDGTFRPWDSINRAAVVTFLWRASNCPEPKTTASFKDMPADTDANQDFRKAISWAAENGITTGYDDNTFRPWEKCNRAAIVTFIWRLKGKPAAIKNATFKDMTGISDFDKAISWGVSNGIITGWKEDNTFRPWRECNRAATVVFLNRLKGE